jgi:hypothetical protein
MPALLTPSIASQSCTQADPRGTQDRNTEPRQVKRQARTVSATMTGCAFIGADEDGHSEGQTTGQTTFPASCSGLMSTTAFAASSFAERVHAAEK